MLVLSTVLAGSLMTGGDYAQWVVDAQSAGQNVSWVSPTGVGQNYTFYENYYDIYDIQAWVSYLGFEFGPFDVHDMLDDTDYDALAFGPLPASFPDRIFLTPDPPEAMTIQFDLLTYLDTDGHLHVDIENVEMGTAEYDLGWPFGTVTVTMEEIYLAANISITASNDLCIGDTNDDGAVDTDDILAVISGWGECPAVDPCPADTNLDWYVNVSDLLWVIAQFGPCP
ncbi:MAG: hypothetical protein MK101_05615 [Phycisphaerales bacterium]|nr:hypothetical protein [Phycisphaerales bacterium]